MHSFFFLSLGRCLCVKENAEITPPLFTPKEPVDDNKMAKKLPTPHFAHSIVVNLSVYREKFTERLINPKDW